MKDTGRKDDTDRAADLPDLLPAGAPAKEGCPPVRAGKNGNVPPVQHQFKPGQSGNPGGRPKRVFTDLLHAYMLSNNQSLAREFVRDLVKSARSGNRTAISLIVNRLDNGHLELAAEDFEPADFQANADAFENDRIEREEQARKEQEAEAARRAARDALYALAASNRQSCSPQAAPPAPPARPADDDYDEDEEYEDDPEYEDDDEFEEGAMGEDETKEDERAEDDEPAEIEQPAEPVSNPEQNGRPGGRRGPTHTATNEFAKYANGPWIDI